MSIENLDQHVAATRQYLEQGDQHLETVLAEKRNAQQILETVAAKAAEIASLLGELTNRQIPHMQQGTQSAEDTYKLGGSILRAATEGSQNEHAEKANNRIDVTLLLVNGTHPDYSIPEGITVVENAVAVASSGIQEVQAALEAVGNGLRTVERGAVMAGGCYAIAGAFSHISGQSEKATLELAAYQEEVLQTGQ